MYVVFDESYEVNLGGDGKNGMFTRELHLGRQFVFVENPAFTQCVKSAIEAVKEWIDYAEGQLDESFDPLDGLSGKKMELQDHTFLAQAFETALSQSWPPADKAVDRLWGLQSDSRNRKRAGGDPEPEVGSTNSCKRSRGDTTYASASGSRAQSYRKGYPSIYLY